MSKIKKHDRDEQKSTAIFLLVFFLLSIAAILLGIACLGEARTGFVSTHFQPLSIGVCAAVAILCGVSVWSVLAAREVLSKSLLSVYVLLIFSLLICLILQKTGFFEVIQSAESLEEYLKKTGIWMPVLYVFLQFLQVIVLPIPSVVSTVAGVALFGAFRAMIYSLIGILIGSFLAFFIGRKLGNSAVAWLVGEDALKKWQRKLKGKDNLILSLMFLLPVFPDDVLCMIAGLSSMTFKYFAGIIIFSRLLGIATTCYLIDYLPFNTWWGVTAWGVFFAIIICVFVLAYKNLDKLQKIFTRINKKR